MSYRKILVAVDFSVASRVALDEAADLAAKYGAELTILHVESGPTLGALVEEREDDRVLPTRLAMHQQLLGEWKEQAWRRCDRPVHASRRTGVPWQGIVSVANEGDFDLIVLGSHGRSGLAHVLLGSVAEKVVAHAPCPVFVVRPRPRRSAMAGT